MPTELTNPMLNFNDSLRTTSAILIEAMNTRDVATQLGARRTHAADRRTTAGPTPTCSASTGRSSTSSAESTSPDEAERVVVEAQKLMRAEAA